MDITLFLRVLSVTAIFTTIALFFCGIPICINIWRRKSTFEISGMPFLMGALGGTFWLRYGWLKWDLTMVTVNAVGVTLFNIYLVFYFVFTKDKCVFGAKYIAVQSVCAAMMVLVHFYGTDVLDYLGLACMTFNIINFGAPLAGLGVVLRKRCCDTLPLPMCVANLLVSFQWFLYGNIVRDFYVMLPNGCGLVLAVLQLSLFIVFPMQSEGVSLLSRLLGRGGDGKVRDAEAEVAMKHTALVGQIWRKMSDTTKNFMKPRARSGSFDSCSTPGHTMSSSCESDSAVATPQKCHRTLSAPDISSIKRRISVTSKDVDC